MGELLLIRCTDKSTGSNNLKQSLEINPTNKYTIDTITPHVQHEITKYIYITQKNNALLNLHTFSLSLFLTLTHTYAVNKLGDNSQRAFARILKGCGARVAPVMPSVLSSTPSTVEKLNFCSKLTKNRKSSILAKPSPRHARLPRKRNDTINYICIPLKNLFSSEF